MLRLATKFAPDPEAVQRAYRAGFRYAELWLDEAVLANWETPLSQGWPFQGVVLHFPNRLDVSERALGQCLALARHLRCECLVLHQPHFDRYQERLLQGQPTLALAVENGRLDRQGLARWARSNPGLTLDVEHLWKFTLEDAPLSTLLEEVQQFLKEFGPKLRHVHLPGYWPGFAEHRPMYSSREMVLPVLALLSQAGFAGLVVSEVDCPYQNPFELQMDVLLGAYFHEGERDLTQASPGLAGTKARQGVAQKLAVSLGRPIDQSGNRPS